MSFPYTDIYKVTQKQLRQIKRANSEFANAPSVEVFCIPLGLINSSRNVSHQFFSLNVEGAELAILNTILFDIAKIDFIKCRLVDSMYNNISPFISI